MRYGVTTVSPDESVSRVMQLMTRHRVRHTPMLRDGNLVGIISIGDVVKHRLEDLECETNVLREGRQRLQRSGITLSLTVQQTFSAQPMREVRASVARATR